MSEGLVIFESVADALAVEQDMLASQRSDFLLWESRIPALVAPARLSRTAGYSKAAIQSAARGWAVEIRSSGGGVVPQGPGILNLSMVWQRPEEMTVEDAYLVLCKPIRAALQEFGLVTSVGHTAGSFCDGQFNLSIDGRKVAGTAQRWRASSRSTFILAHAFVLVDTELAAAVHAVDRFQQDLAFGQDIHRNAHTSILEALGQRSSLPDKKTVSCRLDRHARSAIEEVAANVSARAVA